MERLTQDIEFAQVELEVVAGLKTGNDALKKINEALNISDIEKILDETRDGIEKQNVYQISIFYNKHRVICNLCFKEIDELLHGALTEEDEEAVQNEYEQLIIESMPNVPSDENVIVDKEPELPDIPEVEPGKMQFTENCQLNLYSFRFRIKETFKNQSCNTNGSIKTILWQLMLYTINYLYFMYSKEN